MRYEFRAWSKLDGEFIKFKSVVQQMVPVQGTKDGFFLLSDFILDMYIGRKDINGKKIFAEDIVEFVYNVGTEKESVCGPGVIKFGNFVIGKDDWGVEHSTPGFAVEWDERSGKTYSGIHSRACIRIIGNTHQNFDLLKKKKEKKNVD